jgi:hypothetical protein
VARNPYPIDWPPNVPRTRYREESAFAKSRGFTAARDGVYKQIDMMGSTSHVVITSNLPLRSNGVPYSAGPGMIADPGIAVWWVKRGTEHAIACDRWKSCVENMRAIEKTLEALRGIARWGSAEMVDSAFAGFAALPPGSGVESGVAPASTRPQTWRELFGVSIAPWCDLPAADLLAIVKTRHREEIKKCHPDKVGASSDALERTMRLNSALQAAELELLLQ